MGDKSEIDLRLARRGGTDSAVRSSLFAAGLQDGGADKVWHSDLSYGVMKILYNGTKGEKKQQLHIVGWFFMVT